jgi:HPt (histidine-containing phosphotransfer) domain-containing protein
MDEYLTKPIEPAELLRVIHSMLSKQRPAEVSLAAATPEAKPQAPAPPAPVDLQSLTRRCVNNRKLAAKALRMFDSRIDRDIAALTRSLFDANPKAVAASAHKIKGAAANISAESIRKMAADLEKLGRADTLDQSQAMLDQLNQEVASLRQYLQTALPQLSPAEPPPTV